VRITAPGKGSITVDLFDEGRKLACEVKTSFRDTPYDPFVLNRWTLRTLSQLSDQKRIANACGWKHCVVVNKPWLQQIFSKEGYDVRLLTSCASPAPYVDPYELPLD
jgi:hypothetical protein